MRCLAVILMSFLTVSLYGQGVNDSLRVRLDPVESMGYEQTQKFSSNSFNVKSMPDFSEVSVGMDFKAEDRAWQPQEGDGLLEGFFRAESQVRLDSRTSVKGGVSYTRGVRRNVFLAETSDYQLLYPYVVGDTVGGDLQKEQYAFHGAFSTMAGRFMLGVEGSYRALHEYRNFDPRPRNISSDFYARVSAGTGIGDYMLSLSLAYRKYHQSHNIEFVSQKGANATIFHFTGLGAHFARFQGTSAYNNTRFRGKGFEVSALAQPADGRNLYAGLSYKYMNVIQHLIGQNEAPITSLLTQNLDFFAACPWTGGGAMLQAGYELRQGTEDVIDNFTLGFYNNLLGLTLYRENKFSAGLDAVQKFGSWFVNPVLGYERVSMTHLFTKRTLDYSSVYGGVSGGLVMTRGRMLYRVSAGGRYVANVSGGFKWQSEALDQDPDFLNTRILDCYDTMCRIYTDNRTVADLSFRIQREVGRRMAVFATAGYTRVFFSSGDGIDVLSARIGINF